MFLSIFIFFNSSFLNIHLKVFRDYFLQPKNHAQLRSSSNALDIFAVYSLYGWLISRPHKLQFIFTFHRCYHALFSLSIFCSPALRQHSTQMSGRYNGTHETKHNHLIIKKHFYPTTGSRMKSSIWFTASRKLLPFPFFMYFVPCVT